jgi:hypothetical protein
MGINEKYKRGLFLLFLLLSIISGATLIHTMPKNNNIDESSLSTSAPEDFYEPNNVAASAYDLSMSELKWLSLMNGPGAQWDDDWYKIYVSPGEERLIVKLIFKHIEGDIDLEVYNSTLNLMAGSYSVINGEFIDILVPSGEYYIKVYYGNMGNNYDLLWDDINPAISDDFYEENDGPGSGYIISANQGKWLSEINGLGIQGDEDWFEIYVNTGFERLVVDCIFSNESGNIDIDIYNGSLFMVGGSWSDQNHEHVEIIVPSSGVYYIRLHYGNGANTYDMRWDSLPVEDMYEENDFDWEAYNLSPWPASWLPFGLGVQADEDWYEIYLDPGEERLYAELTYSHISGNIDMEVWYYDGGLTYLTGSHTTGDNEYIDVFVPWFGVYYIRIIGDNSGNTYDLWWEDLSSDDWMEENDDFWSSWWVDPNYYGGLKIVDYDEDWFHVYLNPGDTIEVYVKNFDHSIGDLELELYSPSYDWKDGSYSGTNEEYIHFPLRVRDEPGDWRIRVYRVSGNSSEYVHYDLDIWVHKGREDPYEWNDFPEEAFILSNYEQTWLSEIHGTALQGSDDWYRIFVTPGFEHLEIDVEYNYTDGNIDIELFSFWWDFDHMQLQFIQGNYTSFDNEHLELTLPNPGGYLIKILGDFNANEYDLWWDDHRTDFRSEDNYEDNDGPTTAFDLTHEVAHYGEHGIWGKHLDHISGIGIQSDNDWYKLYIPSGTDFLQLRVITLYEYSAGPIGIELYDSGFSKLSGNFTMDDNEYIKYVLPSNGTYYIRVYGDNSGSPYDLWWSLQEDYSEMIPGYDVFILLGGIIGVVTVISIKWKRSKMNH